MNVMDVIGNIHCHYYNVIILCFSFNGVNARPEIELFSKFGHSAAGNSLGEWKGLPFVAGGYDTDSEYHAETEIVEYENSKYKWTVQPQYPFHKS